MQRFIMALLALWVTDFVSLVEAGTIEGRIEQVEMPAQPFLARQRGRKCAV